MKRIVVGITGASGIIYAYDLLKKLSNLDVETHVVISAWGKKNLELESYTLEQFNALSDYTYSYRNQSANIASGSFLHDGMVIIPASMKTIASIACGFGEDLVTRAADVTLKEQRKLIIVPRETPLSAIHLENLTKLARLGVQVIPPIPAFYNNPKTIQDLVDHETMKILDAFGIKQVDAKRWGDV